MHEGFNHMESIRKDPFEELNEIKGIDFEIFGIQQQLEELEKQVETATGNELKMLEDKIKLGTEVAEKLMEKRNAFDKKIDQKLEEKAEGHA